MLCVSVSTFVTWVGAAVNRAHKFRALCSPGIQRSRSDLESIINTLAPFKAQAWDLCFGGSACCSGEVAGVLEDVAGAPVDVAGARWVWLVAGTLAEIAGALK